MTKAGSVVECRKCGDKFKVVKRGNRVYCSTFCSDAARKERQKLHKREVRKE